MNQLEQSKLVVESVHARLKQQWQLSTELVNLENIEEHLSYRLKSLFQTLPLHSRVNKDIKIINNAFLPVLNYIVSYKPELGLVLQRMIETYNILILD